MSLVNRKNFVSLVSAICILSVAVACAPRKKDWKARTKPAGQTGPGGVDPRSPGGITKVEGAEKQECISFSAQKDQPLYLDSAVEAYLTDASQANGKEAFSDKIMGITTSGGWILSNEGTKSVKIDGMGTSFNFDNSVLDASGCYEIAIQEAKYTGSKPTFFEDDVVAIRFLNEVPGNQVFQISNVGNEAIKRSIFEQVKSGRQGQKSEIKLSDIKRINAILIQTESSANAKVVVAAPSEADKAKAQDIFEKGLSGRSVSVTSTQIVYASAGTNLVIDGNVENIITFKGGDSDETVMLISNQNYSAAVSNEVAGNGVLGPINGEGLGMAITKNDFAKPFEGSPDYTSEFSSKLESDNSSFKVQVQMVPSQDAKAISSQDLSFVGEDGQVIPAVIEDTVPADQGPNF